MANYMKQVAAMLGVEMGERFQVVNPMGDLYLNKFYFTEEGVVTDGSNTCADIGMLRSLICGTHTIKHTPRKPAYNELYYSVEPDGAVYENQWGDCSCNINYYKLGNCYRTCEQAESNKNKWIAFYSSDEVLEV